jgi:hypothetical protein
MKKTLFILARLVLWPLVLGLIILISILYIFKPYEYGLQMRNWGQRMINLHSKPRNLNEIKKAILGAANSRNPGKKA